MLIINVQKTNVSKLVRKLRTNSANFLKVLFRIMQFFDFLPIFLLSDGHSGHKKLHIPPQCRPQILLQTFSHLKGTIFLFHFSCLMRINLNY